MRGFGSRGHTPYFSKFLPLIYASVLVLESVSISRAGRAQIMATMSMMKKALHMGMMEAESAARIFLEDSSRPKRRETRMARRERTMVMGMMLSRGPMTTRDMLTTTRSKTDQLLEKKAQNQWLKRLMQSSTVKTTVNPRLILSSVCFRGVRDPSEA
jgi:hypothetical protein